MVPIFKMANVREELCSCVRVHYVHEIGPLHCSIISLNLDVGCYTRCYVIESLSWNNVFCGCEHYFTRKFN